MTGSDDDKPDSARVARRRVLAGSALALGLPAAACGAAPGPQIAALNVRDAGFGAVGDGVADDSRAFDDWLDAIQERNLPGFIPAGRYRVSNLTPITTRAPLTIVGEGRDTVVLLGDDAMKPNPIHLAHSLSLSGVSFTGWPAVITVTDGTDGDAGRAPFADLKGRWRDDIASIEIRRCSFVGCQQAINAFSGGNGRDEYDAAGAPPMVERVVLKENEIDGATGGFHLALMRMRNVWVVDNDIRNIDGTAAGSRGDMRRGIRQGAGRAIYLGRDANYHQHESGGFFVNRNIISGVHDRRDNSRDGDNNPETQAIFVVGAQYVDISHNHIDDVIRDPLNTPVADVTDCEGIYCKAVNGRIAHNTLINTGRGEASITLKGRGLSGEGRGAAGHNMAIVHNRLIWNHPEQKCEVMAIRLGGDNVDCSHNYVEGYANSRATEYGPIYEPSQERQRNLRIAFNTIRRNSMNFGIVCRGSSSTKIIEGNIIEDTDASSLGAPNHTAGIYVKNRRDVPVETVIVRNNQIGDLANPADRDRIGIWLHADKGPFKGAVINGNVVHPSANIGIHLQGDRFEDIEIHDNVLSAIETPVALPRRLKGLRATRNAGWLSAVATLEWGRFDPGEVKHTQVAVGDAEPCDAVRCMTEADLGETFISAQVIGDGKVRIVIANMGKETKTFPDSRWRIEVEKLGRC